MKRIMIVTNSLTGGGAERSMNLVSNELTKRGWPVALVPINSGEPDLIAPTCEVFPLNRQWRGSVLDTLLTFLKFNRVVRSWNPDVIVLNCDLPELFGAMLPSRRRFIVVEHTNPAWSTRMRFGKFVRSILKLRNAFWVAVSSHLNIWPDGESPHAVLQNPLTSSAETNQNLRTASRLRRLVYIGRLSTEKRPEFMLEIANQCQTETLIIGDGPMKETLQKEVASRNLKVRFDGYVRNPWNLIQPGDLLIVPSAWEGDGLVVIEGMKGGTPLLLSDIPDFRRFGLPERNYCKDVDDFVERISQSREVLNSLVVPKDIEGPILASRSLKVVGDSWEKFLNSI